ncbi:MAG: 50S ribosomal protein L32 [Planctomycetota bacterium]
MAVPKKRKSHGAVRMRRNHDALKPMHLTSCSRCGARRRSHTICGNCGTYRDKVYIEVEEAEFE